MFKFKDFYWHLFENSSLHNWGSKEQPFWRPGANPTVDTIVFRERNLGTEVLLIRRAAHVATEPGKWALPGGFHDSTAKKGEPFREDKETVEQAAIRELEEETGIKISNPQEFIKVGVYEGNNRDPRDNEVAWAKTTAFAINIGKEDTPTPRGMDDADMARWIPLNRINFSGMAFDHGKILKDAIKKLNISFEIKEDKDDEDLMASQQKDSQFHQSSGNDSRFWGNRGAGVVVYCEKTGRYLIGLRSRYVNEPNTWGTFGGKIDDDDEDPKDAAKREMGEETGYTGEVELTPIDVFQSGNFKFYNFLGKVSDEYQPKLSWENSEIRWMKLDEFPNNLHFGLKRLLPKLDKFKNK